MKPYCDTSFLVSLYSLDGTHEHFDDPDAMRQLEHLRQERKFSQEDFYPGAPNEEIRVECEQRVNDFLGEVILLLQSGTEPQDLFARARALTEASAEEDTEECEKVDDYIGEAMSIVGLKDWTDHV